MKPDALLVEINTIGGTRKPEFVDSLFLPVVADCRARFPFLQARYEPASLALGCRNVLMTLWRRRQGHSASGPAVDSTAPAPVRDVPPTQALAALRIQTAARQEQALPDRKTVEAYVRLLKEYIDAFERQGIAVVLFEVPREPALEHTPWRDFERGVIQQFMPPNAYRFIWSPSASAGPFRTTDGVHLDGASAVRYCRDLVPAVETMVRNRAWPAMRNEAPSKPGAPSKRED